MRTCMNLISTDNGEGWDHMSRGGLRNREETGLFIIGLHETTGDMMRVLTAGHDGCLNELVNVRND